MSDLVKLERALRRRPHTAREVQDLLGCSKPTAYEQIRKLRASGVQVRRERRPHDPPKPGPKPWAWRV